MLVLLDDDEGEPVAVADVCSVVRVVLWSVWVETPAGAVVGVASTSSAAEVGETRSVRSVSVRPDCASTVRRCLSLSLMVCGRVSRCVLYQKKYRCLLFWGCVRESP